MDAEKKKSFGKIQLSFMIKTVRTRNRGEDPQHDI